MLALVDSDSMSMGNAAIQRKSKENDKKTTLPQDVFNALQDGCSLGLAFRTLVITSQLVTCCYLSFFDSDDACNH